MTDKQRELLGRALGLVALHGAEAGVVPNSMVHEAVERLREAIEAVQEEDVPASHLPTAEDIRRAIQGTGDSRQHRQY